jgi:flagellar biosynthesis protein FlhB
MSDDQDSKTEEPTGRRIEEARSKGQVAQSREVNNVIMLTAALIVLLMVGPLLSRDLMLALRRFLELPHQMRLDDDSFHDLMVGMSGQLATSLALPMLLLLAASFAPGLLQHGWLWTGFNLNPKWDRINPVTGFSRLFTVRNLVELLKGLLKLAIVGSIGAVLLIPAFGWIENLVSDDIRKLLPALLSLTVKLLSGVIIVMIAMAAADYIYQKYEYIKSLKMTKQEVKDEFKQMEGDPVIKAQVRKIRTQRARQRMMAAVPTATVVVTNPTHYACALKYDQTMNAPVLVAKGVDLLALRIIETARMNFVPVVENPPLARTLYNVVEVDDEIPREHYKAVAEVIGFVMRLKKRAVH